MVHLKDAPLAREVRGQIVVHSDDVARKTVRAVQEILLSVGLIFGAGGVHVVSTGVVGVDRTVDAVSGRAGERVLVQAPLCHDAIGVVQVRGVAHEKLDVTLMWRRVRERQSLFGTYRTKTTANRRTSRKHR